MTRFAAVLIAGLVPAVAGAIDVQATLKRVDVEGARITFGAPDGRDRTAKVAPDAKLLDVDGKELLGGLKSEQLKDGAPVADGKIVLCTIGFSNTSQCSQGFIEAAHGDPAVNPDIVIVNGAQGGRSAFMMKDANDGTIGTAYWKEWVPEHLASAGV